MTDECWTNAARSNQRMIVFLCNGKDFKKNEHRIVDAYTAYLFLKAGVADIDPSFQPPLHNWKPKPPGGYYFERILKQQGRDWTKERILSWHRGESK